MMKHSFYSLRLKEMILDFIRNHRGKLCENGRIFFSVFLPSVFPLCEKDMKRAWWKTWRHERDETNVLKVLGSACQISDHHVRLQILATSCTRLIRLLGPQTSFSTCPSLFGWWNQRQPGGSSRPNLASVCERGRIVLLLLHSHSNDLCWVQAEGDSFYRISDFYFI